MPGHVVTYAAVAAAVACWLTWHRYWRTSPHQRMLPTEAALVAAAIGGWIAAAVTWGPLGWPGHLLTWIYLAGAAGGYWWLRRHEAVRAARQRRDDAIAWAARKAEWHRVAHLIGLGDFHLQKVTPTLLGEELLLTSAPGSDLASRVARNSDAIAEKYAHLEGLPYGRVDISTTEFPGQLVIGIRRVDPSVKGVVYHPLTAPWPSSEPSPYADWFPAGATIRDPVPVGIIPETGEPMTVTLFDEIGAKAIGVHGATGSGKSTLLNDVRERVTAMTDAALVQLNGAHMGDELTWEPLAAATACGPAASDEDVQDKILAVLEWAQGLVTERSATLAETGHSVFQPTPEDPAYVLMIDEVDEVVSSVPGSGPILEFLASKQRKSAVCLILATQRATQKQTGGGMVRANLSQVVIGNTNRATESRHATGAEAEIPDISEYSRGRKGYFQVWDPQAKEITARGPDVPARGAAGRAGLLQAHRGRPQGHQARPARRGARRARPPGARSRRGSTGRQRDAGEAGGGQGAQRGHACRARPGTVPAGDRGAWRARRGRWRIWSGCWPAGGCQPRKPGSPSGMSKSAAHRYLSAMRDAGLVELEGTGNSVGWRLAAQQQQAAPPQYTTLVELAEAVHDGGAPATDEQRAVLEQVWQITHRPHLTILQGGGGDGP